MYRKASSKIAKRNKARRSVGLFLKTILVLVVIAGPIFLLRANFLQIKNIEILGTENISQESVKNTASAFLAGSRFFLIPKSNILMLDEEKLQDSILKDFPQIESVSINKKINKDVEISIKERSPDFLWCSSAGTCFYMDRSGLVFEQTENRAGEIIFKGVIEGDPVRQKFASTEKMQNYLKMIEVLERGSLDVTSINIESKDKMIVSTNIGDILFDSEVEDLSTSAENANLLITEIKSKNPVSHFDYIDARFGNKMFYKLK